MDFDRDAFVSSFVAESQEGLDLMEQSLLAMESSSAGPELLNDIFRVAHTIKGKGVSFMEDDNNWHYRAPTAQEVAQAAVELGIKN